MALFMNRTEFLPYIMGRAYGYFSYVTFVLGSFHNPLLYLYQSN
jgi:hypothetical protein